MDSCRFISTSVGLILCLAILRVEAAEAVIPGPLENHHTFRDKKNRTLDAEVLGLDLNWVYLRRKGDGRAFNLRRGEIEPDDEAWLKAWKSRPIRIQHGPRVPFQPMVSEKWKERNLEPSAVPWEGKEVVLFTLQDDHNPEVMGRFVRRLDDGWRIFEDVVGKSPVATGRSKPYGGRGIIATAPTVEFLGAGALGMIGSTDIEVGYFYQDFWGKIEAGDYASFKRNPDTFHGYYFYEMGRNFYLFGQRHDLFITGFAIVMREICMDEIGCRGTDKNGVTDKRDMVDFERLYSESGMSLHATFKELGAVENKKLESVLGEPLRFTGFSDFYASTILYFYRNHGGRDWVRRFYQGLLTCPPSPLNLRGGAEGQWLNYIVSASFSSKADMTPVFRDRWRVPVSPALVKLLSKVRWNTPGLTPGAVLATFPAGLLPLSMAIRYPGFITPELHERNLLKDPGLESREFSDWPFGSFRPAEETLPLKEIFAVDLTRQREGNKCYSITAPTKHSYEYVQHVPLKKNVLYLLTGWVKTEDVKVTEGKENGGARLTFNWFDQSEQLNGTCDWTYLVITGVNTDKNDIPIRIAMSDAVGKSWYDDLHLIEIPGGMIEEKQ